MNVYTKQQAWKFGLTFVAILIFILSIFYSNLIVKRIVKDERKKILLWAEAIKEKAKLVNYTQELFAKLQHEERKKGELWAEGMKRLISADTEGEDISFIFEVVKGNETLPVILTDEYGKVISSRNLDPLLEQDEEYLLAEIERMKSLYPPIQINILNKTKNYLYYKDSRLFTELKTNLNNLISSFISEVVINSASLPVIYTDSTQKEIIAYGNLDESIALTDTTFFYSKIREMKVQNNPIEVELVSGAKNYIFYQDSFLLLQLKSYPYIQFMIIGVFLIVAYSFFRSTWKSEQNQVWVGMSKETAHQLGTPISSLLAWVELLEVQYEDDSSIGEMRKDINRLETIADRFSKIGSKPVLKPHNLEEVLENAITYLQKRISKKVSFQINSMEITQTVNLNLALFEWVIENITKNGVDAMEGEGAMTYEIIEKDKKTIYLDITDTGKGISKSKQKTIFEPGFTTKQRGWGLGLTLVKRIIENYHKGQIFVKKSEINKGTTFRIVLDISQKEKKL